MLRLASASALPAVIRFIHWALSLLIAAFYIVSMSGWIMAMDMAYSGELSGAATLFVSGLSTADHFMRTLQVALSSGAAILLLFRKRAAFFLFLATLAISVFATVVLATWSVSYLGGSFGLLLLGSSTGYSYWLLKRRVLR